MLPALRVNTTIHAVQRTIRRRSNVIDDYISVGIFIN